MVYHDLPLGWLAPCKPASMQITLRINTSELCENRWVRGSAASGYRGAPHVTVTVSPRRRSRPRPLVKVARPLWLGWH